MCLAKVIADTGLSPLARGNRSAFDALAYFHGPIPARAGEPPQREPLCWSVRAYPRSRGGTLQPAQATHDGLGLSPLARGNLLPPWPQARRIGPIPARAGEPVLANPAITT